MGATEKIERGKIARETLSKMMTAKDSGHVELYDSLKAKFYDADFKENYFRYFGYGFFDNVNQLIPNVPIVFYSFHLMVGCGFYFLVFFILSLIFVFNGSITRRRIYLGLAIFTIPLAYLTSQAGWVTAEMGRQPWVIQDLLPTVAAISHINANTVKITFWLFAIIFTALFIAELGIMFRQIKIGPKDGGH